MASTYLSRTTGTPTSADIGTISFWLKRSAIDQNNHYIISNYTDGSNYGYIRFKSGDQLQAYGTQSNDEKRTNRVFRDTNAWYHIVLRVDTTQSTASDRVRLYINGVQETSFSTNTNVSQNTDYDLFKSGGSMRIGSIQSGTMTYLDGCLSHFHYCDGQSYAPTVFGSTDSTTGEWKINTSPTITMGNNGFTILKDGNTITDQSANSNNFTLGAGTLTKTEDCPSNVFATWNPLAAHSSNVPFFTNGNTTVRGLDTSSQTVSSTLAMPSKGKWYCEMKLTQEANATSSIPNFGIIDAASLHKFRNQELISYNGGVNSYGGRVNSTNLYVDGSSSGTLSSAPDVGDFMGLAVDLDSSPNTIKYYLNGSLAGTQNINNDEYVFACSIKRDNADGQVDVNFGNGYFGTTAVSSAGTNASGNGIFEYNVPTGYTALSTKGLNL